jgi:type IV pilus assembly protein PilX
MLLLLVVTILAVSMFHSFGTQEKIAGNVREKQRALNAAISAQQYAEWWLSNSGTTPPSGKCIAVVNSNVGQVCTNFPADFTAVPWKIGGVPVGVTYTPFTANKINNVANNVNQVASAGSYYAAPVFYITDLGKTGASELYQIDAVGYGGTPNAVAVVESMYLVTIS